jgi:hypothetical protein
MKKRKNRKISFIVLALLFILGMRASAQTIREIGRFPLAGVPLKFVAPVNNIPVKTFRFDPTALDSKEGSEYIHLNSSMVPSSDFYARNMGFMCKREWQLEKAAHIPVRIRIGSLEECNFLEGKSNRPPHP